MNHNQATDDKKEVEEFKETLLLANEIWVSLPNKFTGLAGHEQNIANNVSNDSLAEELVEKMRETVRIKANFNKQDIEKLKDLTKLELQLQDIKSKVEREDKKLKDKQDKLDGKILSTRANLIDDKKSIKQVVKENKTLEDEVQTLKGRLEHLKSIDITDLKSDKEVEFLQQLTGVSFVLPQTPSTPFTPRDSGNLDSLPTKIEGVALNVRGGVEIFHFDASKQSQNKIQENLWNIIAKVQNLQ